MNLLIQAVDVAFQVLIWLIIIRCLLSFIRHDPRQPVFRFIYDVTEPVMRPFARLVPPVGGIDFSPILVIMVLDLVWKLIHQFLWRLM